MEAEIRTEHKEPECFGNQSQEIYESGKCTDCKAGIYKCLGRTMKNLLVV